MYFQEILSSLPSQFIIKFVGSDELVCVDYNDDGLKVTNKYLKYKVRSMTSWNGMMVITLY